VVSPGSSARENSGVSDDNLERRVTAVEAEVAEVRRETAAARALAAGVNRDVADYRAELRAHTRGLEALRQAQIERYAEHKTDLATGLARVEARLQHIVRLLREPGTGAGPANASR
jgi:chromosome segregation ATPase